MAGVGTPPWEASGEASEAETMRTIGTKAAAADVSGAVGTDVAVYGPPAVVRLIPWVFWYYQDLQRL